MDQYLSPKAIGTTLRPLKWLRNAGLAFCAFCTFGGAYTLYLSLQAKDYSHIGGYVFWIVVGAVPLTRFCLKLRRRCHARYVAGKLSSYSGTEVPLRWLYNSVTIDPEQVDWLFENGYFEGLALERDKKLVRKLKSGSAYTGR